MSFSPEDFRLKAALQATQAPEEESLPAREIGAAAGTILGSIAGSFLPGAGTAAGGAIGGSLGGLVGGMFEDDDDRAGGEGASTLTDSARLAAAIGQYKSAKGSK